MVSLREQNQIFPFFNFEFKPIVPSSKNGSCHPGAWWKKQHADQMIQHRVARANGKWDLYWQQLQRA